MLKIKASFDSPDFEGSPNHFNFSFYQLITKHTSMRKLNFSFALFLLFIVNLAAQNESALADLLKDKNSLFQEVQAKSYTYQQAIKWDENFPYKINYLQDKQGKKNSESLTFEFSLQDIDKNTIRVENQKDLMFVKFFINNRQKLIRVFKDGEQQKYVAELKLLAVDADNGRAIKAFLEEALKLAEKMKSPCEPEGFDDRITWLKDHIVTFNINETTYEQSFDIVKDHKTIANFNLAEQGKKTLEERWQFNFADLDERKINLTIKGTEVFVEAAAKKGMKYIYYEKNGEQGNYASSVKFRVNDFEKAKCMLTVLEEVVKESSKMEEGALPEIKSLEQALSQLSENTMGIETEETKISQSLKGDCVAELAVNTQKSKGDPVDKLLKFNFSDVQEKSVEINVKGKQVLVEFSTGKNKMVQPFKNGEIQNYSNGVEIVASDVENAKLLAHLVPSVVKVCKEKPGFKGKDSVKENLDWINAQLISNSPDDLDQSLKVIEESDCKWQFMTLKKGKKANTEEIFEFNLIDLDESAVKFDISGKNLLIEVNAHRGEKKIKYYKNGEPGDYQEAFSIAMINIEDARKLIAAIQKSIQLCK